MENGVRGYRDLPKHLSVFLCARIQADSEYQREVNVNIENSKEDTTFEQMFNDLRRTQEMRSWLGEYVGLMEYEVKYGVDVVFTIDFKVEPMSKIWKHGVPVPRLREGKDAVRLWHVGAHLPSSCLRISLCQKEPVGEGDEQHWKQKDHTIPTVVLSDEDVTRFPPNAPQDVWGQSTGSLPRYSYQRLPIFHGSLGHQHDMRQQLRSRHEAGGLILEVIEDITSIWEETVSASSEASGLMGTIKSIEAPIKVLEATNNPFSREALRQVFVVLEEVRDFLAKYMRRGKFVRRLKRKSDSRQLAHLSSKLNDRLQGLHLNLAVAAWSKQSETNSTVDSDKVLERLEDSRQSQRWRHRELIANMEDLRHDMRQQLQIRSEAGGFVEIDIENEVQDMNHVLGRGGFGAVWKAMWRGTDVAVKTLFEQNITRHTVQKLSEAARVHSGLHFDFLVHTCGASTTRPNLCLVMELAPGGNLRDYLCTRGPGAIGHALQAALLCDVARGMAFLHSKEILHGDLKPSNVLVFENDRLKLCDFGLAEYKQDEVFCTGNRGQGSVEYVSPELLQRGRATKQTDLYSFGVLCFEVATCKEPFSGKTPVEIIAAVMAQERPELPRESSPSPAVESLMRICWRQDPSRRPPNFTRVEQTLCKAVEDSGDPRQCPAPIACLDPHDNVDTAPAHLDITRSGMITAAEESDHETQTGHVERSAPWKDADVEDSTGNKPALGIQLDQSLSLPARGNATGGAPWSVDGSEQGLTLRTIVVWVGCTKVKAVAVSLSDDWTKRMVGRAEPWDGEETVAHESFTFEEGEKITSLSTWDNGCEDVMGVRVGLRAGGFEFTTSLGRSFSTSSFNRGMKHRENVGTSVVVGAHGRGGFDVDSFNFIIQREDV